MEGNSASDPTDSGFGPDSCRVAMPGLLPVASPARTDLDNDVLARLLIGHDGSVVAIELIGEHRSRAVDGTAGKPATARRPSAGTRERKRPFSPASKRGWMCAHSSP
jgi:hypothetical protein